MKKTNNSFYFPHDYNAFNDDKILELRGQFGLEGYGLYWVCLETMAKNEDGILKATLIGGLSGGYGVTKEKLQEFLEYCVIIELFSKSDKGYCSVRMNEHLDWRKSLSDSGKLGAEVRWGNRGAIGGANSGAYANKSNKSKENKEINNKENSFLKKFIKENAEIKTMPEITDDLFN